LASVFFRKEVFP